MAKDICAGMPRVGQAGCRILEPTAFLGSRASFCQAVCGDLLGLPPNIQTAPSDGVAWSVGRGQGCILLPGVPCRAPFVSGLVRADVS